MVICSYPIKNGGGLLTEAAFAAVKNFTVISRWLTAVWYTEYSERGKISFHDTNVKNMNKIQNNVTNDM